MNNSEKHSYRALILDMDGTLVDSNAAHVQAWTQALNENGHPIPESGIWPFVGMGGDNLLPAAAGLSKDSPEARRINERRSEIYRSRHLPHLKPFPEVRRLLEKVRGGGLRLVVASSSPEEEIEKLLEIAGLADLVEDFTSGDSGRSKPEPDVVQAALDRLGLPAAETVMLGDTPYDIQAAGKAGVPVIALRCGGFPDRDLEGALALYDDAADLLAHYDDSPLGARASGPLGDHPHPALGT